MFFGRVCLAGTLFAAIATPVTANVLGSETITFDEAINGVPFFNFDSSDPDSATDVVFSTTDPFGFNTSGPGPEQLFIQEPGLEGTTALNPDLRVDFLQGAVGTISFGFATIDMAEVTFTAFNAAGVPIGTQTVSGDFFDIPEGPVDDGFGGEIIIPPGTTSAFPENEVIVPLSGTAVFGEFNFVLDGAGPGDPSPIEPDGRYIIDNFTFTPAGEDIISSVEGALPENPLLPGQIVIGENGVPDFEFEFPVDENGLGGLFPIFIDPVIAVGYTYTSALPVASILIPDPLPNGDAAFEVVLPGGLRFALTAGTTLDLLPIFTNGVTEFTIEGIDTAELLDPTDPTAFVTGLTFIGAGQNSVTQTPIIFDTDADTVPAPATLLLLGLGLGLLRLCHRATHRRLTVSLA